MSQNQEELISVKKSGLCFIENSDFSLTQKSSNTIQSIHLKEIWGNKKVYGFNDNDPNSIIPVGPIFTWLELPDSVSSVAVQDSLPPLPAGTWGYGNKWYAVEDGDNLLIMDTLTGNRTIIGNLGMFVSGLAFDYSSNKMYAITSDYVVSRLFEVNFFNGTMRYIGVCNNELMINLACDINGNLYTTSLTSDKLYRVNSTTGEASEVGPIGFDAHYHQDMEFDLNSGILYMAAYNVDIAALTGQLRTVDTLTGLTTLIGNFQNNIEVSGFAIPYITSVPSIDAAAVSINGPASSCDLGTAEPIKILIRNCGTTPINSISVSLIIDGGMPVVDNLNLTLEPDSSYLHTFSTAANLSDPGIHNLKAYVTLIGDSETWNDTTSLTLAKLEPASIPFSMGFEPSDNFYGWTTENTNHDERTWYMSDYGGNFAEGCAEYSWSLVNQANDWLISPCLNLEAGITYNLSFYCKSTSIYDLEKIAVYIGTDNTSISMTSNLFPTSTVTNANYGKREVNFSVPNTGSYYIGWQCVSSSNKHNLYLDDINISDATGTNEDANNNTLISIFPNPTKEILNIISSSEIYSVEFYNMLGTRVFKSNVRGTHLSFNTTYLPSGIYTVILENENGKNISRFVKE